jgi:hypothetical protein
MSRVVAPEADAAPTRSPGPVPSLSPSENLAGPVAIRRDQPGLLERAVRGHGDVFRIGNMAETTARRVRARRAGAGTDEVVNITDPAAALAPRIVPRTLFGVESDARVATPDLITRRET